MRLLLGIAALSLVSCAGKKKDATPPVYTAPEIEFPDDDDLDDLPEAGEDDERN